MATLQERIDAFAGDVRDKLNTMIPRLLPSGGTVGQVLRRSGTADYAVDWATQYADIVIPCAGKPLAGEALLDMKVLRPFTLPIGLAGSDGEATTAATNSAACSITKNGTNVATVTFAAGATAPTLAATSAVSFAKGDRMRFLAPATQDGTLADFTVSLATTR